MKTNAEMAAENEKKAKKTQKWLFRNEWLEAKKTTFHFEDHEYERFLVVHPGAVAIIPVNKDGDLILVRQYRSAIEQLSLEIPAGRIDGDLPPDGEAQRELQEEIGFRANKLTSFGFLYSAPGFTNEKIYLFIAEDLVPSKLPHDVGEVIDIVTIPLSDAIQYMNLSY